MRAISWPEGNRSQQTFLVALGTLVLVAAAQLIGALILHLQHARDEPPPPPRLVNRSKPATVAADVPAPIKLRAATPAIAPLANATRRQTPAPSPASIPDELLQVAKALRAHGDTGNAVAKLQQATALAPQNPEILAELAMTFESMQLFDRSSEAWRRLRSLGNAAGPLAELAEMKLRMGAPVAGLPGSNGQSPNDSAPPDSVADIPDGSTFGVSQVTQTSASKTDDLTQVDLRVGVKVRPGSNIDYRKVKIQVFFYDVVDNDQVVLTDADVSYEWITPGHNWVDSDTEVLDVDYRREKKHYPTPGASSAPVPDSVEKATRTRKSKSREEDTPTSRSERRDYLGYIVRVYYKDELQAVRADPTRLLNLFPPPYTAPPE